MTDTTNNERAGPVRVQLSRTKGWKMPENTVKVDRATGFGNPFPIIKCTSPSGGVSSPIWQVGTWDGPAMWFQNTEAEARALSVQAFRAWIGHPAQEPLREMARLSLRGKNLACWCKGTPCHADVLLEIANRPECEPIPTPASEKTDD